VFGRRIKVTKKEEIINKFIDKVRRKLESIDLENLTKPIQISMMIKPSVTEIKEEYGNENEVLNSFDTLDIFSENELEFISSLENKYKLN